MELIEGDTLASLLARESSFSPKRAARLLCQAARVSRRSIAQASFTST